MPDIDQRIIDVGAAGSLPLRNKQPNDAFEYRFDFTTWIGISGATATSASASVAPSSGAPTVTIIDIGDFVVRVLVDGGTDGWDGYVTLLAGFTNGEAKEAEIHLIIVAVG